MSELPKILFQLEPAQDGYPPVSVESINAKPVEGGNFSLQNAPFFAKNVSYGDLVQAIPTEIENSYRFERLVSESNYTSISIILLDSSMDEFLMDLLRGHKCVIEYGEFGALRMLAVAVPAGGNYQKLRQQLVILEDQERLSFSELAVA